MVPSAMPALSISALHRGWRLQLSMLVKPARADTHEAAGWMGGIQGGGESGGAEGGEASIASMPATSTELNDTLLIACEIWPIDAPPSRAFTTPVAEPRPTSVPRFIEIAYRTSAGCTFTANNAARRRNPSSDKTLALSQASGEGEPLHSASSCSAFNLRRRAAERR